MNVSRETMHRNVSRETSEFPIESTPNPARHGRQAPGWIGAADYAAAFFDRAIT